MQIETLKSLIRKWPLFYFFLQRIKWGINSILINMFGLGYTVRTIKTGPLQGFKFTAAKRVFYSKWFWEGTFEKESCLFLSTIARQDAVCYDIGANLGYHVLIMADAAKDGHVYAFEPIAQVCDILKRNIDLNHKKNITIVQKVVADDNGKVKLGLNTTIDQAALKLADGNSGRDRCEIIECDAITLDCFVAQGNKPPSLMKIDVEGAEVDVLKGGHQVLTQYHPLIICETHGEEATRGVYDILRGCNYELFAIRYGGVFPVYSIKDMPRSMDEGHLFARSKI